MSSAVPFCIMTKNKRDFLDIVHKIREILQNKVDVYLNTVYNIQR